MRGLLNEDGYKRVSDVLTRRDYTLYVLARRSVNIGTVAFCFDFIQAVWWKIEEQLGRGANSVRTRW